jgi:16S rRNA (cytosine967-C5)-methyltransferase
MTPAARLSAAIEILDRVLGGSAAEKALTNWGRGNRFAGSGDRHAIRDTVFDALRCKRSFAALGGSETGRGLVLGGLRASGQDPAALFTGDGYAPAALSPAEADLLAPPMGLDALDCPDWLAPILQDSLGVDFAPVMHVLQHRAPVHLRVNLRKADLASAMQALQAEDILVKPVSLSPLALEVTQNARRVQNSNAYQNGLVELQDAASQAVILELPLNAGARVLDYCAGGGGKSLAMAAAAQIDCFAHDIDPRRMVDLPSRATRAGIKIRMIATSDLSTTPPFDLVFADAPCSGSGSWRRTPEAKWALTLERLSQLCGMQAEILDKASQLTTRNGVLAYATCSLIADENAKQRDAFLKRNPDWICRFSRSWTPLEGGDGFFVAIFARAT